MGTLYTEDDDTCDGPDGERYRCNPTTNFDPYPGEESDFRTLVLVLCVIAVVSGLVGLLWAASAPW